MATCRYVVGCPVWELDWALDLWFESVLANVPSDETGLVLVVPPTETSARDVIAQYADRFRWVEVMRDRRPILRRTAEDRHKYMALARNQILQHLPGTRCEYFIAWDPNYLLPSNLVPALERAEKSAIGVWGWLNREEPARTEHDGQPVLYQKPVQATAMKWQAEYTAIHYPSHEFEKRAKGTWKTGVLNTFVMLDRKAWPCVRYEPHRDGCVIPLCWQLKQRKIQAWCYGERLGLHLPEYRSEELDKGYPKIMAHAAQIPLQAMRKPAEGELGLLGLYPLEDDDAS